MQKWKSRVALSGVAVSLSLVSAGVVLAGPNSSATAVAAHSGVVAKASNGSFSNILLTTDQCGGVSGTLSVTATGTTDDGGGNDTVWFTIFDDGVEKFAQQINIPVGTTTTTNITVNYPGQIGTINPGIGLELGELRDNFDLADTDPFFPTVVSGCSAPGAAPVPALSTWSMGGIAGLLALMGFGALYARRRGR